MKISELVSSYESQLRSVDAEIKRILDSCKAEGRSNLSAEESKRTDELFDQIDSLKNKLASAKKIEAEEAEYARQASISVPADLPTRNSGNPEAQQWLRNNDGRPATVERGKPFASHEVVRAEMSRFAERDKQITEAHEGYAKPRYCQLADRCPECLGNSRHAASHNRQRLPRTIERRFLHQFFHDGEAVAVRSYVGT
jgi:hypothetical protein